MTLPHSTPRASASPARETLGRVLAVSGSQVTIGLPAVSAVQRATVGKFLGMISSASVVVGVITEVAERPARDQDPNCRSTAELDLVGEIKSDPAGAQYFQRGVTDYPVIGELATPIDERELGLIFNGLGKSVNVGVLQHDSGIEAGVDIDQLVGKHFAVVGTTGVGKSNGVAFLLNRILQERPQLRIFLIDPHNEYSRCFGERAQVLTPRNLRLPFWLFNFEETIDAFFGSRPGVEEEIEILSETIPLAKTAYLQLRTNGVERVIAKKKERNNAGYGVDTPVPYRIEDLVAVIDERMGKLENKSLRPTYHRLLQRIHMFRNHPRYGFMFENATVGGDTMAEVIGHLFRMPANGTPMTIMQLAGFPSEVVDAVVSVLARMAFDFGLWSDGATPLLFVCEEAHRYAPASSAATFGPTRRALSRIAKEGRKYGVFLGLVTQRPAEIDPTIVSQCSTLFVMRLANERDQALVRSAVSDAGASLLTAIPSLGTGEAFAFGAGVPLPTRLKFHQLPPPQRPASEAGGSTRPALRASAERELIDHVVDRWRASTMGQKPEFEDDELGSWREDIVQPRPDSPPIQPAQVALMAPPSPPPQLPPLPPLPEWARPDPHRPLGPDNPAPLPSRYRQR